MRHAHCDKIPSYSSDLAVRCDAIINTYQHRIYRQFLHLSGSKEEVDDLSQELGFRLLRSGHTYIGEASVETWLYTVCRNLVIDHRRKRRLLSLDELRDQQDEGRSFDPIDHRPAPLEVFRRAELSYQLSRLLLELDEKQSTVIALRFWADCELNEISEITRVPLNTVRARLHRGLRRLKAKTTRALAQRTMDFDWGCVDE